MNLHVNDFLHVGGDPKWLNGLENAPQKLQNLGELNKVLAHRPWLITKEHIEVSRSKVSRVLEYFLKILYFLEQFYRKNGTESTEFPYSAAFSPPRLSY